MYRTLPSIKYLIHHCTASVVYRTPKKIQGRERNLSGSVSCIVILFLKQYVYISKKNISHNKCSEKANPNRSGSSGKIQISKEYVTV